MADLEIEKNRANHTMVIRFNRPDSLNALTPEMNAGVRDAVAELVADPDMRVCIVTGTGRAFSAGADLKAMVVSNAKRDQLQSAFALGEISADDYISQLREASGGEFSRSYGMNSIEAFPFGSCPKPVIAAVNGLCVAGGMEMAIDCDIRVASEEAYFGVFEAKRGILAGIAVHHLARTLPAAEAMYLLLTCDRLSAQRAHDLGFVQEVTAPEKLMDRAQEIAAMIAKNAPLSVQASKAMVQFYRHQNMEESRRMFEYIYSTVFNSEDAKEGPLAFAEKREAVWLGR
jgi:enoyl-CoA hydratase/carnithine racemase